MMSAKQAAERLLSDDEWQDGSPAAVAGVIQQAIDEAIDADRRSLSPVFVLCERIDKLRAALIKARETIHALHGYEAWEIFEKHSPEMKQIDAALQEI